MTDNRINDVLSVRRRVHSTCFTAFGDRIQPSADPKELAAQVADGISRLQENRPAIRAAREELQQLVRDCLADNDSSSVKSLLAPGMAIRSLFNASVFADRNDEPMVFAELIQCGRWLRQDIQQHGGIDL